MLQKGRAKPRPRCDALHAIAVAKPHAMSCNVFATSEPVGDVPNSKISPTCSPTRIAPMIAIFRYIQLFSPQSRVRLPWPAGVLVPTSLSRTDIKESRAIRITGPILIFGLLKFNMEGNWVKRYRYSTYRKSNSRQFFNLNRD